jgi:hypothetical protein
MAGPESELYRRSVSHGLPSRGRRLPGAPWAYQSKDGRVGLSVTFLGSALLTCIETAMATSPLAIHLRLAEKLPNTAAIGLYNTSCKSHTGVQG